MHPDETRLNDFADGSLDADTQREVAQHVATCSACSGEITRLRELRAALSDLPREIRPDRDLRADIWRRVEAEQVVPLWRQRARLAAAAVLLIAVTAVVTRAIVQDAPQRADAGRDGVSFVSRNATAVERQYTREVEELEMLLRKSRSTLAPETVRILEENLAIINRAIGEAQAALADDPNSGMLVDLLRSAYERKLELLRQAARSSATT